MAETGKPISEVADDLGTNEATLASWVSRAKRAEKGKPAVVAGVISDQRTEYSIPHAVSCRALGGEPV
ncbi:hypothetical protein ACFWCW_37385, partial [Streptomyces sp. NPDC060054]